MPIGINPTTGEAVFWDGKAWVPTQTATNPETGDSVAWDGFTWEKIKIPEQPSGLGAALSSGTDILQGGLYSALEGGAKSFGLDSLSQYAAEGVARNKEEAAAALPNPQSFGEAQSLGEYFTAAKEALGTSLPSMAPMAAGAAAGAGIGSIVPGLGTGVGALIGGTLGGIPGFYGSNREAQKGANQGVVKSEGAAILTAIPQAVMDSVLSLAFPGLGKAVAGGMLTRVVKKGAEGIIEEVPTEIGQQVLERYQAGLPIGDEEAIRQYKEVAMAAGVIGGGLGGVGGALQGRIVPPAPEPQTPADLAEHIANVRANMPGGTGGISGNPAVGPSGGPLGLPSPPAPAGLLPPPPPAPPALMAPEPTPLLPSPANNLQLTYQPQADAGQFLPQSQPDLIEQLARPEAPKPIPQEPPRQAIPPQAGPVPAEQILEAAPPEQIPEPTPEPTIPEPTFEPMAGANALEANRQAAELAAQAQQSTEVAPQQAPVPEALSRPQAVPEAVQPPAAAQQTTPSVDAEGASETERDRDRTNRASQVAKELLEAGAYGGDFEKKSLEDFALHPSNGLRQFGLKEDDVPGGYKIGDTVVSNQVPGVKMRVVSVYSHPTQPYVKVLYKGSGPPANFRVSTIERATPDNKTAPQAGPEANGVSFKDRITEIARPMEMDQTIHASDIARDLGVGSNREAFNLLDKHPLFTNEGNGIFTRNGVAAPKAKTAPKQEAVPQATQQPAASPQTPSFFEQRRAQIERDIASTLLGMGNEGKISGGGAKFPPKINVPFLQKNYNRDKTSGSRLTLSEITQSLDKMVSKGHPAVGVHGSGQGYSAKPGIREFVEGANAPEVKVEPEITPQTAATQQNIYDEFASTKTAQIVVDALGQLNLSSGDKIDTGKLLEQVNSIRRQMDVAEETRKSLKRSLDDLSKSKNPPVTGKGNYEFRQFFVAGEKVASEQKAAPAEEAVAPERVSNNKTVPQAGTAQLAVKGMGKTTRSRMDGTKYEVNLNDGTTVTIYRDTDQFGVSNPVWYVDDPLSDYKPKEAGLDIIGFTKEEAIKKVAAQVAHRRSLPDPKAKAPKTETPAKQAPAGKFTAENVVDNKPPEPGTPPSRHLIFMPCSRTKAEGKDIPARKLYKGVFFQTLESNIPFDNPNEPQVLILSAKHGVIKQDRKINPYDQKMDRERSDELIADINFQSLAAYRALVSDLTKLNWNILLVGGEEYQRVMREIIARLKNDGVIGPDVGVMATSGGIGEQRSQLGKYLKSMYRQAEEATPAEEAAAPEYKAPEKYEEATIIVPGGARVDVQYEVVELDSLKQAEGELQNRDRSGRKAYDAELTRMYSGFKPEMLGGDNYADRGAPIVGDDNIIDSGNGRALLLGKVYDGTDDIAAERRDAYKAFLEEEGYNTEGFEKPVLIRRRQTEMTPDERRTFVVNSNKDTKSSLSITEQAATDADALKPTRDQKGRIKRPGLIDLYEGGDITLAANRKFVEAFINNIASNERGAFMTADGGLSSPGARRIMSAIKALAYDDIELLNTLEDVGKQDNEILSVGNALENVAGRWAQLREGIVGGAIRPEFDVTKQLVEAAKTLREIRRDPNANLKSYLEQQDMFSEKDDVVTAFLKMFHAPDTKANGEYKPASQKSIIEGLNKYVNRASEQSTTPDLLGDVGTLTPDELINDINAERENKSDQGNMFASVLNASLPKKLTGAKPRYGFGKKNFPLAFESDFGKAIYIAYRKQNPYREWLVSQGVPEKHIDAMGKDQRDNIKSVARDLPSGQTLNVPDIYAEAAPAGASKAAPKPKKKGANAPKDDFEEEIAPTAGKRQAEAAASPQPVDPERLKQSRAIVKKFLQDMIARGDNNAAQSALKAIKDKGLSDTEVHHYLLAMDITSRILGPTKIKPAYLFTNLVLNHPQAGPAAAMAIPPGRSQKYMEGLMIFSLETGSRKRIQMNAFHEAFHILQGLMEAHDPKTAQIIKKAFRSDMTLDDVDPSIKRALQSATHSEGMSYWDFFKGKYDTNPALKSEFKKDYEAAAYMFGLLAEAKQNGQNLNTLMPAFKRLLNFIEQFKQRMGNALNGLGYRSVQDVLNEYAAGRQQRGYELKGNAITSGGTRASMLGAEPDEREIEKRRGRAGEIANGFWNKDAAQAAEWLANNTKPEYEPIARKVADRLKLMKRAGMRTTVTVLERGDKPILGGAVAHMDGKYGRRIDANNSSDPEANVVYRGLTDDTTTRKMPPLSDEIALHELIHAAIHGSIALARRSPKDLAPNLHEAVKDLNDLRNFVVGRYNDRVRQAKAGNLTLLPIEQKFDKWNTLDDEDEFVAWGMTSPEFQKYLDDLPTPSGLKTRFDDFVNAIRKLLGLAPGQETSLSKLIQISADMLGVSVDELRAVGNARNERIVSENQTYEERTDQPMASVLMDDESAHAPEINEGVATVMQGAATAARSAVGNWQKVKMVAKSVFDPLAKLPNTLDYLIMRYRLVGRIDELEDEAKGFRDRMGKATKEQSMAIFEYLTTRGAAVPNLPDDLRDVAITVKQRIKDIGRELSDPKIGILSPQSVAMYEDMYLPRLYMKYLLEEKGFISTGARMGKMEYAMGRTNVDEETRVALGEVKDPGFASFAALYRPQRDMAVLKFLKGIAEASDKDWVYPNQLIEWKGTRVTAFWLADEANNIRERMMFEPDATKKATMARVADQMQRLAVDNIGDIPSEGYKRLPKSNRYGALKGLAVREEIYNDLIAMGGFDPDPNLVDKIFGDKNSALAKGTQFWKMSKTILNPPTQVRQIISNAVMLNLSGVPLHKVGKRLVQAIDAIRNDGEIYRKAKEYGIRGGGFNENELREGINVLREYLAENTTGMMNPKILMNIVAKLTTKAGDFYQFVDQVFKVAKIIDEVERKGISRMPNGAAKERAYAEAALEGHEWFFDYSLVHRGIRSLRTMPFGAPFITYYYKALPLIVKVATNPRTAMRFAPYIALMAAMPAMVASMYDVDDEDVDKLKMSLSDKLREKPNMLIFPYKDQNDNWQFLDWGYFFPWAMFVDTGRALAKGDVVGALGTVGALTSPALSLASAIKTNVDPFTGRQIINEYDPPNEKMKSLLSYVNSLLMPPIVTSYGAFGKAIEAATNSGVNRYGEPNMDAIQITARAIGFNFYPVVPELQRVRNIKRMDYEIQMVKSNMTQSIRDKSLTPEKRASIREEFNAELKRRRDARNKYIQDSAIPAALSSRAKE